MVNIPSGLRNIKHGPLTCLVGTATSSDIEAMKPIPHITKQPGKSPMKKVNPLPQL